MTTVVHSEMKDDKLPMPQRRYTNSSKIPFQECSGNLDPLIEPHPHIQPRDELSENTPYEDIVVPAIIVSVVHRHRLEFGVIAASSSHASELACDEPMSACK